jgi:hypothetical protein
MTKKEQIEELYIDALNNDEAPNVFADRILFLFGVSGTLDLDKMQKKFDKLIDNFSVEDFDEWRKSKG